MPQGDSEQSCILFWHTSLFSYKEQDVCVYERSLKSNLVSTLTTIIHVIQNHLLLLLLLFTI